ncbi:MAG TPA: hypothetical protein VFW53_00610, partial [Gallionella sp.]|nr:hypothetical protein [Gallionella sp.]
MINPELKRNLWLSFSAARLIAMPAILALTFLSIYLSEEQALIDHFMYTAAVSLFVFIVWLWGAGNASASITDEIRNKTWDQQRMSALEPWTMAWGKLFGATAFNWYGGLICLGVIAATGTLNNRPGLTITLLT